MTNSSDKRKKGPIRVEAIVPFALACVGIWAYFTFFFDGHLRRGLEYVGTLANGAQVDVATFRTSFLKGSLRIQGIEVTHPDKPTHNRVQLGEIHFKFLWDALLRAKFVVNDASVLLIETDRPRKKPGRVLPPEPPTEGPSWMQSAKQRVIAQLKEEIGGSSLGRAAKMLEGFNPAKAIGQLKTLKTAEKIDQLLRELAEQEKAWSQALSAVPGAAQIDNLKGRVNAIDVNISNPAEAPGKIAQLTGLLQESQGLVSSVKGQGDALTSGVTQFGGAAGVVEASLKEDRKMLEAQLQLPKLDAKDLAKELFGQDVLAQAKQAETYVAMAREYMPAKGKKDEVQAPPPRGQGRNYRFGTPRSYPMFWLQKAVVSSKISDSEYAGNFEGTLVDFTSEPKLLNRPAVARVKGEFTQRKILGIELLGTFDHAGDVARDEVRASVASFPIAAKMLTKSEAVDFGFAQATGRAVMSAVMEGDRLVLKAESTFRELEYLVRASSRPFEETLRGVVAGIQTVTAEAQLMIENGKYDLDLRSNLATELERGFKRQLDAKLTEARKKIDEIIQKQIGEKRAMLTKRYDAAKGKILGQLGERRAQVEAVEKQAHDKIAAVEQRVQQIRREQESRLKKIKRPF